MGETVAIIEKRSIWGWWVKHFKWRRRWKVVGNLLIVDVVEDVHVDLLMVRGSPWG